MNSEKKVRRRVELTRTRVHALIDKHSLEYESDAATVERLLERYDEMYESRVGSKPAQHGSETPAATATT